MKTLDRLVAVALIDLPDAKIALVGERKANVSKRKIEMTASAQRFDGWELVLQRKDDDSYQVTIFDPKSKRTARHKKGNCNVSYETSHAKMYKPPIKIVLNMRERSSSRHGSSGSNGSLHQVSELYRTRATMRE